MTDQMGSDNPLMGMATAILACMLDGRPGDALLLAESVDPDDRLTLIGIPAVLTKNPTDMPLSCVDMGTRIAR